MLKLLNHRNLPAFVEAFSLDVPRGNRFYVATTFIEGESLESVLQRGPLREPLVRELAHDVCNALVHLHSSSPQVVHRDVKPANIVVCDDGRYVLVDLGSVRVVGEGGSTGAGVATTFGYAPPFQSAETADGGFDLYSLGVTLKRCLTGLAVEQLVSADLPQSALSAASKPFREWVERLGDGRRGHRFESSADALSSLGALMPPRLDSAPKTETNVRIRPRTPQTQLNAGSWLAPEQYDLDDLSDPDIAPWRVEFPDGRVFLLRGGGVWTLGRAASVSLSLPEPEKLVSQHHARLSVTRAGLVVEDLRSANGTSVDGSELPPIGKAILNRAASILLGESCAVRVAPLPVWSSTRPLRPFGAGT